MDELLQTTDASESIRIRPTQQGAVYLWTIGIFSLTLLALGENLIFLLGALALGCGVVAAFLGRRNLRGLSLERRLPKRTRVGLPTPLTWSGTKSNGAPAVGILIQDRPAPGLRPASLRVDLPVISTDQPTTCTTQVIFNRRGVLNLASKQVTVSSRYPLGLFQASARVPVSGQILVRPQEVHVTSALRARLRGRSDIASQQRRLSPGTDVIYGVREFREGDDPRRIHWRSTARRGLTIVSEWRAEQGREVLLVLGRGQGAGRPALAAFERAVTCAATLWRASANEHMNVRLLLGGRDDLRLASTGHGLEQGLDALARVPSQGARKPREILRRHAERAGRRTVIYIGAGPEEGLEGQLKAAAGRGGQWMLLRSDLRSIRRWFKGLTS